MITELPVGYQLENSGFIFTLGTVYMSIQNLDGDLLALVSLLGDNGLRVVRSQEQFETEVAFWLKDNLSKGQYGDMAKD